MQAAPKTIEIHDPSPFGEVILAPSLATGRSEAQLARAMAGAMAGPQPASAAEALQQLRTRFPQAPLSVRVAALHALMRR